MEFEDENEIAKALKSLNRTIERISFNGAALRENEPGGLEGLTLAAREVGGELLHAVRDLTKEMNELRRERGLRIVDVRWKNRQNEARLS